MSTARSICNSPELIEPAVCNDRKPQLERPNEWQTGWIVEFTFKNERGYRESGAFLFLKGGVVLYVRKPGPETWCATSAASSLWQLNGRMRISGVGIMFFTKSSNEISRKHQTSRSKYTFISCAESAIMESLMISVLVEDFSRFCVSVVTLYSETIISPRIMDNNWKTLIFRYEQQ